MFKYVFKHFHQYSLVSPVLTNFYPFSHHFLPIFNHFEPFLPCLTHFHQCSPVSSCFHRFYPFPLVFTHFTSFNLFLSVSVILSTIRDSVSPKCGIFSFTLCICQSYNISRSNLSEICMICMYLFLWEGNVRVQLFEVPPIAVSQENSNRVEWWNLHNVCSTSNKKKCSYIWWSLCAKS